MYYGAHITATGIVRCIGTDSHGTSSIELAEEANGTGYVLGAFGSYEDMEVASVGDWITMEGGFPPGFSPATLVRGVVQKRLS